jgi:hypothetical protein
MITTKALLDVEARSLVGCGVYHRGEHGTIIGVELDTYKHPMVRIEFPGMRVALLKFDEIGSR